MINVRFIVFDKHIGGEVDRYVKTVELPLDNLPNATHIKLCNVFFPIGEICEQEVIYSVDNDRFTVMSTIKSLDISTNIMSLKEQKSKSKKRDYILANGWEKTE